MSAPNKTPRRFWLVILLYVSWASLVCGFVLVGRSALEIAGFGHVTTNTLSWSLAGLFLLLIGSLINSCCKQCKLDPPIRFTRNMEI